MITINTITNVVLKREAADRKFSNKIRSLAARFIKQEQATVKANHAVIVEADKQIDTSRIQIAAAETFLK